MVVFRHETMEGSRKLGYGKLTLCSITFVCFFMDLWYSNIYQMHPSSRLKWDAEERLTTKKVTMRINEMHLLCNLMVTISYANKTKWSKGLDTANINLDFGLWFWQRFNCFICWCCGWNGVRVFLLHPILWNLIIRNSPLRIQLLQNVFLTNILFLPISNSLTASLPSMHWMTLGQGIGGLEPIFLTISFYFCFLLLHQTGILS